MCIFVCYLQFCDGMYAYIVTLYIVAVATKAAFVHHEKALEESRFYIDGNNALPKFGFALVAKKFTKCIHRITSAAAAHVNTFTTFEKKFPVKARTCPSVRLYAALLIAANKVEHMMSDFMMVVFCSC